MMNTTAETMCDYRIALANAGEACDAISSDPTSDRDEKAEFVVDYMRRHAANLQPCGKCDRCVPPPAPWEIPTVSIYGYEFTVEYAWLNADGSIHFVGICTDNPVNNSIRNTGYNGGTYTFCGPSALRL